MAKKFSTSWKSSKNPRKQRKYLFNAPLHLRHKFLAVHLSKELREKYGVRAVRVAKGDRVKVLRGDFKGIEGKVERVDLKKYRVYIDSVERTKVDGSKVKVPIHPSNLLILELNLEDPKRKERLEKKVKVAKGE